ncbi:hypothetical protein [Furfurilactobacillus siliginis]|uniref:Uncharacterized protein n=1 Tax=Furfurilactobacillus siliginis TaxID=348151 RepID=A0A0R2L2N3_9LACO|nr:hypothetical protein [Furfurilactobacillus siliginis]KRN96057.1 hypothetical protein IV55_GL001740 [Furfurilactobacillus siliginis]GEK28763.1 hypothetical protein LSI01_10740 [Furfurilactobacillus siliginis]
MKTTATYHVRRHFRFAQIFLVLLLWVPVVFLVWLNVMFDLRVINDYLAPLYNLFNIEYTPANLVVMGVLSAATLITICGGLRLLVLRSRGQQHA